MDISLRHVARHAGLSFNPTMHVARHTFGTLAIEYGMPMDVIAKIMGHRNVNMTRHYAQISRDNISREMMCLGMNIENNIPRLGEVQEVC